MGKKGDLLVLMSFAQMTEEEARKWVPRTITLAECNSRAIKEQNTLRA